MQEIKIVNKLSQCYLGIEDQLCNRHTTHLTAIKHKFEQLYSKNKLTHYIIAKGLYQLTHTNTNTSNIKQLNNASNNSNIMMSIENGITIAIAKTQSKGNIYINYNKWQELSQLNQKQHQQEQTNPQLHLNQFQQQLILNYKGQIQQQVNLTQNTQNMCKQISYLYQMAVQDISLSKINGAIIYIHSNLKQNTFYQKQALLYAFYIAILKNNQLLEEYNIEEICQRMGNLYKGKYQSKITNFDRIIKYAKIFHLSNNNILVNQQIQKLYNNNTKFIFAKLNTKIFKKNKTKQIVTELLQYQNMLINSKQYQQNYDITMRMAEMKKKYEQLKQIYKNVQNIDNLLNKVLNTIQGFFIAEEGQYLVLLSRHCYCHQIVRNLAKIIKEYANISSNQQQIQNKNKDILGVKQRKGDRIIGKWGKTKVNECIFTSLPSVGVCILNPVQEIWFIQ